MEKFQTVAAATDVATISRAQDQVACDVRARVLTDASAAAVASSFATYNHAYNAAFLTNGNAAFTKATVKKATFMAHRPAAAWGTQVWSPPTS